MAYQLKTVCYQGSSRKILLQNENGPCPLLAAANALLLRGVIALDSVCTRNGVASTEDIVNMLANRAISAGTTTNNNNNNNSHQHVDKTMNDSNEFHLHEVLSLLPSLEHGMDVNPKFTAGPNGVEYTNNLAAFDLLGVELVHGWLLDPQDRETAAVVQSKSYNELIETVILGNEARETLQRLENKLCDIEMFVERQACVGKLSSDETIDHGTDGDNNIAATQNTEMNDDVNYHGPTNTDEIDPKMKMRNTNPHETNPKLHQQVVTISDEAAIVEMVQMREQVSELSLLVTQSEVANSFLEVSGHQLTYHGLEQLHTHVGEDKLCVFFRNNHFATLTKHSGVLYLLVTDLGYANTPEIVWEKLDNIDGDTEYCNEFFEKPTPRMELKPVPGPTIAPELLLAQRNQAESDYHFALALSQGDVVSSPQIHADPIGIDDDESRLIEAAKELSLKTYQNESTYNDTSTTATSAEIDRDMDAALMYHQHRAIEEEQAEHESEQLARQLQELEYARQRPAVTNPTRQAAIATTSASRSIATTSESPSQNKPLRCSIS